MLRDRTLSKTLQKRNWPAMELQHPRSTVVGIGEDVIEKMVSAVARVRERQAQIVRALEKSSIPFVLSGSNAAFVWIANIDDAATRQYRSVELIVQRNDIKRVMSAMTGLGFTSDLKPDRILIRSTPNQRERWADNALFADESLVNADWTIPSLDATMIVGGIPVLSLEALIELQLCRWSLDDRVDLRDMIEVGLLDSSWPSRLPPELAARLQELLDDPDG